MHISIYVPAWLLKDFIQSLEGTTLDFYMYRFHFGSLTVKDQDQCFQVTCCPYFPLVVYTVDTRKFVFADDPDIGLDETTRNHSALFLTWSKFPDLENGVMPEPGWYPN